MDQNDEPSPEEQQHDLELFAQQHIADLKERFDNVLILASVVDDQGFTLSVSVAGGNRYAVEAQVKEFAESYTVNTIQTIFVESAQDEEDEDPPLPD